MPTPDRRVPEPQLTAKLWKKVFARVEGANTLSKLQKRHAEALRQLLLASGRLAEARMKKRAVDEKKAKLSVKFHTEVLKLAREKVLQLGEETPSHQRARQFSQRE